MITFYHAAPSRSSIVHWLLEEIGEPYELKLINLKKEEQKAPAYLAVNPLGKVPAVVHDGVVVTEAAAICCYLADAYPKAGLAVPIDDSGRGPYLKWLFFGPSCLEPAIIDRAFPRAAAAPAMALGYGSFDAVLDTIAAAVDPGPYILGERFTAADVVMGSGLRWGTTFKMIPERAAFARYMARLNDRPALKRATAKDVELAAANG